MFDQACHLPAYYLSTIHFTRCLVGFRTLLRKKEQIINWPRWYINGQPTCTLTKFIAFLCWNTKKKYFENWSLSKLKWNYGWLALLFGFSSDYHYVLGPAEERCSAHHNVQPRSADAGPAQTLSVGAWSVQPGAGFATKKGKQSRWKTETRRIAARSVQRAGSYISSKKNYLLVIFQCLRSVQGKKNG